MKTNAKMPEKCQKFYCINCDFKCSKESNYKNHMSTRKHKKLINANAGLIENATDKIFACDCGKIYKHMSSLCKHKKTCIGNEIINELKEEKLDHEDLIKVLMKQNEEFKSMLIEQNNKIMEIAKEGKYITNNNNNTTNNNNFNLNFFLNEKCKDALNIMDFINQLQLKLSDLDMVGRVGYTEGISKIFIRGLKELDVFKRPIHCSDLKRETLYVKDKDAWEKDNDNKEKLKLAIKHISAKNMKNITAWVEENPESEDYDSKKHMEYHNIIIKATGGSTKEEDEKNYNKIISNVAKEVMIDKTNV
jgi:hypothetical protein|uniref:C2H2-type domain-containing protein n=1 Tax=viral metagenome TaxID=1070528 RepID=A0A6C0D941_9ZZZZ